MSGPHSTFCGTAQAKSGDSVVPDTQHAPVLLPVPGRSRDKPRSYDEPVPCMASISFVKEPGCAGYDVGFLQAEAMLGGNSRLLILAVGRRSAACPAIYRAAVAKSGDSMRPDPAHVQVLLPVPGRSRDKPRSYDEAVRYDACFHRAGTSSSGCTRTLPARSCPSRCGFRSTRGRGGDFRRLSPPNARRWWFAERLNR